MKIGGFQKQSLIDYPGNISAVVFTQGCNFLCSYCHNPELVLPERFLTPLKQKDILDYLKQYKKLLDAVCISGGEPTIQKDLPEFINQIRKLGLKIKLDTNGTNPKVLEALLDDQQLDFIAMDIKHCLDREAYSQITAVSLSKIAFNNIKNSIELIKDSGVSYEFRTTYVPLFHTERDVECLRSEFAPSFKLQTFKYSPNVLNPGFYQ